MEDLAALDATAQPRPCAAGPSAAASWSLRRSRGSSASTARSARWRPLFEHALAETRELDAAAPFAGVPFVMKDLGACSAGQPYYAGNRALREIGYKAPAETYLARRFRLAGLVPIATSKTPEFGLQSTTQPLAFGPSRNPWSLSHTPGGSSGGSAVAVAAGIVPLGPRDDGAGSIRIPAAFGGLVGLKPPGGALRSSHHDRAYAGGFAVTRSVRDAPHCSTPSNATSPRPLPPAASAAPVLARGRQRPGRAANRAAHGDAGRHHAPRRWPRPRARRAARNARPRGRAAPGRALFEEERACGPVSGGRVRLCLRELGRLLGRPAVEGGRRALPVEGARSTRPELEPRVVPRAAAAQQPGLARPAWFASGFDLLLTPPVTEPPPLLCSRCAVLDPTHCSKHGSHLAFTERSTSPATGDLAAAALDGHGPSPLGVQLVARLGRGISCFASRAARSRRPLGGAAAADLRGRLARSANPPARGPGTSTEQQQHGRLGHEVQSRAHELSVRRPKAAVDADLGGRTPGVTVPSPMDVGSTARRGHGRERSAIPRTTTHWRSCPHPCGQTGEGQRAGCPGVGPSAKKYRRRQVCEPVTCPAAPTLSGT